MVVNDKPHKKDFTDMREFLRAAAEWANANMNEWLWGGPKDDDDEYYFVALFPAPGKSSPEPRSHGGGK